MEINHIRIHKLSLDPTSIVEQTTPITGTDFSNYVSGILGEVCDEASCRRYKVRSNDTQVISVIRDAILNANYDGRINGVADRLLTHERDTQERMAHMKIKIRNGILIQACIVVNNVRKYIICKAEDAAFINESDYARTNGYPEEKKVIKSFLATFDENHEISEILIKDPSSADYWWNRFLEVDQHHDDAHNTRTTFKSIDAVLSQYKKYYPADHFQLRAATITALKSKGEFNFNDFVFNTFTSYTPVDDNFKIVELTEKIRALPKQKGFDTVFQVIPSEIKAKLRTVVNLTDNLDLLVKENHDNSLITAFKDDNDLKYIQIRTDAGYETFKKPDNSNDGASS